VVEARGVAESFTPANLVLADGKGDPVRFDPATALQLSEHAAEQMTKRGVSLDELDAAAAKPGFSFLHDGVMQIGHYDEDAVYADLFHDDLDEVAAALDRHAQSAG
jgi:hypothetical protein